MRELPDFPNFVFCPKCWIQVQPAWLRRTGPVVSWHKRAGRGCPGSGLLAFKDTAWSYSEFVRIFIDAGGCNAYSFFDIGTAVINLKAIARSVPSGN